MGRKPFPQINPFRSFVTNELNRRRTEFPSPTLSPFIRLTSCMGDAEHKPEALNFFTLGLHGFDIKDINIFDQSYTKQHDIVGYAYTNDGKKILVHVGDLTRGDVTLATSKKTDPKILNEIEKETRQIQAGQSVVQALGTHPIPGVVNATVRRMGLGTPVVAQVEYVCYNKNQLEFLRNHFMIAGAHVVIEWGNQSSANPIKNTLKFDSPTIIQDLIDVIQKGRGAQLEKWVTPNDGNYDFLVGVVSNFQVKVNAAAGIWTCTVDIVANGEQFRGISNFTTYFDKNNPEQKIATTIADYFKIGGNFDALINKLSDKPALVAPLSAKWNNKDNINLKDTDSQTFSTNPEDYRFVSWEFFAKHLIPSLFGLIRDTASGRTLNSLIDFWIEDSTLPPDEQGWVGDNIHLKSTTPDTMIIIKRSFGPNIPQSLTGAGYFDEFPGAEGHRGKLKKGIWLNAGMIRKAFQTNSMMEQSIRSILSQMNAATDNFWQLILYFDDEVGKYVVIDAKYGDPRNNSDFYRFNQGGEGETLDLDLDSAFPPELVSQMMLYGFFKSQPEWKRKELLEKLPSTGAPNTFIFSMNWTNLRDLLQAGLSDRPDADKAIDVNGLQIRQIDDADDTAKGRVIPVASSPATPTLTDVSVVQAGKPIGSGGVPKAPTAAKDNTRIDVVRNSSKGTFVTDVRLPVTTLADPRIDPDFKVRLEALIDEIKSKHGMEVNIAESYRPQERQDYLYAQGRNGDNRDQVTWTQNSYHTTGQAADLLIFHPKSTKLQKDTAEFFPTLQELAKKFGLDTLPRNLQDFGHVQSAGLRTFTPNGPSTMFANQATDQGEVSTQRQSQLDEQQKQQEIKLKEDDIRTRFGDPLPLVIELLPSNMTARIVSDGYNKYPKPNGHVVAFPTTTTVTVTVQGTSGLSVSDGFFVDKLPFVFERYGVFQIVEISESITNKGWITKVRGIFKLLWLDGDGSKQPSSKAK